jgi:hypothetical protein
VPVVVLLGPQRFTRTLGAAVAGAGVEGLLAVVTAGWQEREAEDLDLFEHLGRRTINLMLYARSEDVFERDPDLFRAHRERQERLRELQSLYRIRLHAAREAARQLLERRAGRAGADLIEGEQEAALQELRRLDAHHLRRVRRIDEQFDTLWRPLERPSVVRHSRAIRAQLARAEALALAGGHVAILLNRLRLFGIEREIAAAPPRTIFAWSAGAMAAAERVVLFHDSPPQGPGVPEVLQAGMGWARGVLPLPHAGRRLDLGDPVRVELFARRFAPDVPVAFEDGAALEIRDEGWHADAGARRLDAGGELLPIEAA